MICRESPLRRIEQGDTVMNLVKEYAAHARKHLGYFPVWQPGDAVAAGDVGELEHGVFRRQASLSEVFPKLKLSFAEVTVKGITCFRSEDCSATGIQGEGTVPVEGAVDAEATVRIAFGRAGGAVFDAEDCMERYIANLLEVRTFVERHRDQWPPQFKLATRVTAAKRFRVLISGAAGASVDVAGDAKARGSWNLAHAKVSISNEKNVGYQRTGSGAILVGLYGFGWFGKQLRTLSGGEVEPLGPEFRELPARDPSFD
jgi:hypothetical protein